MIRPVYRIFRLAAVFPPSLVGRWWGLHDSNSAGQYRDTMECEELLMTDTLPPDPELKFAIDLARLADQTRCHNVVLLDLRQKSPVTKFFLLATGTSDRQRRTVGDELIAHGKLNGFPAWRSNGYETAKWIVVDFIDVVAHIFEEASRNFYDLEMLWGDCPRVAWQLPQPDMAAVSAATSTVAKPSEITQEPENIMAAPALADSDTNLDSDKPGHKTDEPQVEEFIDEELFVAQSTDDGEAVEATAVEILAVSTPVSRAAIPRKRRESAVAKPAVKTAGKSAKTKTKAVAKAKLAAGLARRAKPTVVKIAKAKAGTASVAKAKKLSKAQKNKSAVARDKAARPGAKKAAAKKTIAKKIAPGKPAAEKKLAKPAAGKSRGAGAKQIKKPAVKTKKR